MIKYTEKSIRAAMMEIKCQGLEGHHPKSLNSTTTVDNHEHYRCRKCNRLIAISIDDLIEQVDEDEFAQIKFDFGLGEDDTTF